MFYEVRSCNLFWCIQRICPTLWTCLRYMCWHLTSDLQTTRLNFDLENSKCVIKVLCLSSYFLFGSCDLDCDLLGLGDPWWGPWCFINTCSMLKVQIRSRHFTEVFPHWGSKLSFMKCSQEKICSSHFLLKHCVIKGYFGAKVTFLCNLISINSLHYWRNQWVSK